MKNNKLTISIGVSVFNEEKNIISLLDSILSQIGFFHLIEIIVISDGSTDNTVKIAKTIIDKRIKLIDHKKREGKVQRFNEIVSSVSGDILIMFDADIIIEDKNFISKLIEPFLKNEKIGLVGANTISAPPKTFFEKIIADSHECKQKMYKKINNGNTLYLCHGRARAFRKELYTHMHWFNNCPEDAQSYLLCIQKGFLFKATSNAKVLFRSPTNLADHARQHYRFRSGQKRLQELFPEALVKKAYFIPKIYIFEFLIQFFIKNPITMVAYVFITIYLRLQPEKSSYNSLWAISYSTKEINV